MEPSRFQLVPVPPPEEAPMQPLADALGLPLGLRAEKSKGGWRCASCSKYQIGDCVMVWVPDSVRASDSIDVVTEIARRSAYNGHASGWCLKCVARWKVTAGAPGLLSARPTGSSPNEGLAAAVFFAIVIVSVFGMLFLGHVAGR